MGWKCWEKIPHFPFFTIQYVRVIFSENLRPHLTCLLLLYLLKNMGFATRDMAPYRDNTDCVFFVRYHIVIVKLFPNLGMVVNILFDKVVNISFCTYIYVIFGLRTPRQRL